MSNLVRKLLFASLLVSIVVLAGCQSPTPSLPATLAQVPRIRAQELKALLEGGEAVVIVDTRSRESYEQRHVPGAISIPFPDTEARQGELPRDTKIVLYCT
jgi:3-mercaptopyruvate sulfurtransferase SseA